jgi:hypothetical protein
MSRKSTDGVTTIGIDIGKNSFHLIGLDGRLGSWLFSNSGVDVKLSVMFLSGSLFSPR